MTAGALELRHVSKHYGSVRAVDDVSFTLQPGEFMTLLGPSGSGKTTTLTLIAGLDRPSGGSILLDGVPLDPLPPYRRNVGVVFQNYALFPHLSVARNVAFPLEMRRAPAGEIARKVARALDQVGLAQLDARYPRELSGGQQQRVALARAMVFEPRLLLMDEPLSALDRKLREQMQIEIKRLHRELGVSVVYVTHDQDEALMMSDRIAVFNHGRIEQIGTPEALYDRPASRFVAGFLGELNFFPAVVAGCDAGLCRLTAGALTLTARVDGGLEAGGKAVVMVRPERMHVAPGRVVPDNATNAVCGTVTDVIYLGRSRKFIVLVKQGAEVTAIAQAGATHGVALGDAVVVTWQADDAIALREG